MIDDLTNLIYKPPDTCQLLPHLHPLTKTECPYPPSLQLSIDYLSEYICSILWCQRLNKGYWCVPGPHCKLWLILIIVSTAGRCVTPFYLPRQLHRAKVSTSIGLMLQLWMNLQSGALDKIDELEWRGDIKQWTSDKEENRAYCTWLAINSVHALFRQAHIGWEMV